MLFEAICYGLSGFFMKISDEAIDVKNNTILAIIADIICAVFTVLICLTNGDAACIFISILIGTILARKVDAINHVIAAIILVVALLISHVPRFSLLCLVICTIAAYLDEKGNDEYDRRSEENTGNEYLLDNFLKYRYFLKIAVIALSMMGLVNMLLPSSPFIGWYFFDPLTFLYFYIFELAYEFVAMYFDGFYDRLSNIIGRVTN